MHGCKDLSRPQDLSYILPKVDDVYAVSSSVLPMCWASCRMSPPRSKLAGTIDSSSRVLICRSVDLLSIFVRVVLGVLVCVISVGVLGCVPQPLY